MGSLWLYYYEIILFTHAAQLLRLYDADYFQFKVSVHRVRSGPSNSVGQSASVMTTGQACCYIYMRIPKTGSYTLRNLVSREYRGRPYFDTHYSIINKTKWNQLMADLASLPLSERTAYRAVVGHMKFGLHEILPQPSRYITFLRNPLDRFASYYYMLQRQGLMSHPHEFDPGQLAQDIDAHESLGRELDNGQTRALANADLDLPFGQCSEKHLQQAQSNLDKHFAFVGLMEQFNLSLMLLQRICGWRWHFYVPKNISPPPSQQYRLPAQTLQAIASLNHLDERLLDYARKRFVESAGHYGIGLKLEHGLFVSCNTAHIGLHNIIYPLKQKIRKRCNNLENMTAGCRL